ncbi:MAG: type II toxin-antitoxin system RelE/ParE family toxin [Candidatus Sulfotelmatobacter sp.]
MARSKPYRLHPLAWLEIEGGENWYRQHSLDASLDFIAEVSEAIKSIREAPNRWAMHLHGTRRFVLDRFPFSIVYLDTEDLVSVVAVAHSKRKPGYWKIRI